LIIPNAAALLELLADMSTLNIFCHIARSAGSGEVEGTSIPITNTSLTRRQYYRRLSLMTKMGLIVRKHNGKYDITLFGRLIYAQIQTIMKLVDHYRKIQAIDSIRMASSNEQKRDHQFIQFVNTLVGDEDIKRLLLNSYSLGTEQTRIIPARSKDYHMFY